MWESFCEFQIKPDSRDLTSTFYLVSGDGEGLKLAVGREIS